MKTGKLLELCFAMVAMTLTLSSCGDDDSSESPQSSSGSSVTVVSLEVSPTSVNLSGDAGATATFTITTNSRWSIKDLPSWVSLSSSLGNGNATITITTTSANMSKEERFATLFVNAGGEVDAGGKIASIVVRQSPIVIASNEVYIHDELIMSDGYCAYITLGDQLTQYAGLAIPVAKYESQTEDDILAAIKTGNHNSAKAENNYCVWSSRAPNTEYVICIAGLDADGNCGPLTTRHITTKSNKSLYNATIGEITTSGSQWKIPIFKQAECDYYYIMSTRNDNAVQFSGLPNIYLAMLAKTYIASHPTSYETGTGNFVSDRYSNDYALFVYTWGVNRAGVYSGVISSQYKNLRSSRPVVSYSLDQTYGQDADMSDFLSDSVIQLIKSSY